MTALLEAAPELVIVEERQPSAPVVCTRGGVLDDEVDQCPRPARWEALCMGCGHVFRRCQEHYDEDAETAALDFGPEWEDVCHRCALCWIKVYIQQYGRI